MLARTDSISKSLLVLFLVLFCICLLFHRFFPQVWILLFCCALVYFSTGAVINRTPHLALWPTVTPPLAPGLSILLIFDKFCSERFPFVCHLKMESLWLYDIPTFLVFPSLSTQAFSYAGFFQGRHLKTQRHGYDFMTPECGIPVPGILHFWYRNRNKKKLI